MRAFVCVGLAIVVVLLIVTTYAYGCRACCGGQPCNPALATTPDHVGRVETGKGEVS